MNNFIITEYNPLHNGHIYQLNQLKGTKTIMMSGSFTQRGERAILDKYQRAEIALKNGVDLVLEMPTIYSLQSAEHFSLGPIQVMNSCQAFDQLVFGAENSENDLKNALTILLSKDFLKKEKEYFEKNLSYQEAHQKAFEDFGGSPKIFQSNNILSLEYLKALKKTNSNVQENILLRKGADYQSLGETYEFMSATGIREKVFQGKIEEIKSFLPKESYELLKTYKKETSLFPILQYNLEILERPMNSITGFEEGMEGLFRNHIEKKEEEFYSSVLSKRYRLPRIKRLILNYLLNITKDLVDDSIKNPPGFIKILGFNKRGSKILSEIKNRSKLKIITNYRQVKELSKRDAEIYHLDLKASLLAFGEIKDYSELILL